eukprot:TRINITY_DN2545_c0_g1_i1.p1 TRINITY_DN2545_c0_g1~~TRINITY_DN2545_c0_g1_i1.p1  ORF type:complete len:343 (+),score=79.04 TRINITY_DN2545_c0_g1_i1:120-1031(+)
MGDGSEQAGQLLPGAHQIGGGGGGSRAHLPFLLPPLGSNDVLMTGSGETGTSEQTPATQNTTTGTPSSSATAAPVTSTGGGGGGSNSTGEAAARTAQLVAARLYVKQATANRIAQVKLAKQIPLPTCLDDLLQILNQFDQSQFGVLWFATNFTMFYHEYCLHLVSPDKARPIGFRTFNPIFHDPPQSEIETIYQNWLETFNNITSITQGNLIEMLKSERSAMHLNLFRKAYEAIWARDFQAPLENVDLEQILQHLHALFLAAANEPDHEKITSAESYTIIRHIIVTFVHMASKDYEMITRSLQ